MDSKVTSKIGSWRWSIKVSLLHRRMSMLAMQGWNHVSIFLYTDLLLDHALTVSVRAVYGTVTFQNKLGLQINLA